MNTTPNEVVKMRGNKVGVFYGEKQHCSTWTSTSARTR